MTAPHDRPTASELLQAVKEWMEQDLMAGVDGRLAFHVRVAMNMLDIVDREITLGVPMEVRHEEVLRGGGLSGQSPRRCRRALRRIFGLRPICRNPPSRVGYPVRRDPISRVLSLGRIRPDRTG